MKINVILITYNQSTYIRQCMEGLLIQKCHATIEVIVADDCSTDDTLAIIKEYAASSSFIFSFSPSAKNIGYVKNYKAAFGVCNADYIAVLEGDDYWTDPLRLDKHIQFLQHHPECSMAMNRVMMFNQFDNTYVIGKWSSKKDFQLINTKDMALENRLGNFSACVFRKNAIDKLTPDLFELEIGDWIVGLVLGQYGFIGLLKEVMSVYRIHQNGVWSGMSEEQKKNKMIECIKKYDAFLGYKYTRYFTVHSQRLQQPIKTKSPLRKYFPPVFFLLITFSGQQIVSRFFKKYFHPKKKIS